MNLLTCKHVVINIFASVVGKCTHCFRFIQKIDNPWRSPCVRLNFEIFTANMTQYHKDDLSIGNPKTHHTMHITAETCFVTGI